MSLTARLLRGLDRLEETLIVALMAAATAVIFAAVVHRFLVGFPIPVLQDALLAIRMSWAQELCIYFFVWMAKFGAAYGVRTGIHVGVDVLINRMDAAWRGRFILFGLLAGAVFTGMVGALGAAFVGRLMFTDQVSPDLELPMWLVYLCIPLGSFLMSFRFLQVAWLFRSTGELPSHDHASIEGITPAAGDDLHPRPLRGEGA
jgi:C4-dicarboxylate transporter DctQ subunit